MITVGNIVADTNGRPKQGAEWHNDGSKLTLHGAAPESRARTAVKCGGLHSITRVQGSETSSQAELKGALIFAELADPAVCLTPDRLGVAISGVK